MLRLLERDHLIKIHPAKPRGIEILNGSGKWLVVKLLKKF
jgi:hypothetical protein